MRSQLLSILHSLPAHQTREQRKGARLDAARWAACPGAQPSGDPLMLVGLSCHLLCLLFECDLLPKESTLTRVRGLCLHSLPQTDKLASISAYELPPRSPGASPRSRGAGQCVVSTSALSYLWRRANSTECPTHTYTDPCNHHI